MPNITMFWKLCLSILDKSGPTILVTTAAFVSCTRSVAAAYYAIGAFFCTLSVKFIKRCIRQPRPTSSVPRRLRKSYGMPSTHSASITFLAIYVILACSHLPVLPMFPATVRLAPIIVTPYAVSVIMSRVWLGQHTWPQVLAGASYGLVFSVVWFGFWRWGLDDNIELRILERYINGRIDRYFQYID